MRTLNENNIVIQFPFSLGNKGNGLPCLKEKFVNIGNKNRNINDCVIPREGGEGRVDEARDFSLISQLRAGVSHSLIFWSSLSCTELH